MTKLRWAVLVIGSVCIFLGTWGLIHHIWLDSINIGFAVLGAVGSLITIVTALPSEKHDTPSRTTRVTRPPTPTRSRPAHYAYENASTKVSAKRLPLQKYDFFDSLQDILRENWIWIGLMSVTVILSVTLISRIFVSPPDSLTVNGINGPYIEIIGDNSTPILSKEVYAVAWSPDGNLIATAGSDNKVRIWDVTSKKIIETYSGHKNTVHALAWSHDGTRIASADVNGIVQVWEAMNEHTDVTYTGHSDAVNAVAWSPNDARIASASDDMTVKVWDVIDGTTVYTYHGHHQAVTAVAWSHDGKRIVSGASFDKNEIQVWDATTGANVISYSNSESYSTVDAVAWSHDDTRIASSGDNTVRIWDAATGGKTVSVICLDHQSAVNTVAWSPDGTYVASGSDDDTVTICDPATGSTILTYQDKSGAVYSLDWSPDGKRIASASDDGVQIWDATDGKRLFTLHT